MSRGAGALPKKITPMPTPPTWAEVHADVQKAEIYLASLGVDPKIIAEASAEPIDLVYKALCSLWIECQRQPTHAEMFARAGLSKQDYDITIIKDLLYRLKQTGRIVSPRRGVYYPTGNNP